ncbi:hypothetical protein [Pseudogemmobacter sonorensis]|uniref:hypothetical protein n=1 Tax=Pseudogemmobacter sonorensis TaxID=2989681 RepID=UPI0036BECC19
MGKRQTFTEAQARRFIRAARAEDPRAVVEIVTEAGTVRIMPDPTPIAEPREEAQDKRTPISWT